MARAAAADHARNEPCPCGSGIKYKKCCLPKGGPPVPGSRRRRNVLLAVAASGALVGLIVALVHDLELGLAIAGGWVIAVGCYLALRNPPPPKADAGDPASLDFGG